MHTMKSTYCPTLTDVKKDFVSLIRGCNDKELLIFVEAFFLEMYHKTAKDGDEKCMNTEPAV